MSSCAMPVELSRRGTFPKVTTEPIRRHALAKCEECPLNVEGNTFVPSDGPHDADVVLVGEAPGYKEAISGKPFTGASGKLLNGVLNHVGIDRKRVFITNACLCRPPDNDTPSAKAMECCAPRLKAEVEECDPKIIVALGASGASAVMGSRVAITKFRAGPPKKSPLFPNAIVIPTFHPAACLRSGDYFPSFVADMEKISNLITIKWEPPTFVVAGPDEARSYIPQIGERSDRLAVDIETFYEKDNSFQRVKTILCVGVGYQPGKVVVFDKEACDDYTIKRLLGNLLAGKRITAHNGKFDVPALIDHTGNRNIRLDFDTMLAHYALDERQGVHGLKYLGPEYLGIPDWSADVKGYRSFGDMPTESLFKYNAYDVAVTWDLAENHFRPALAKEGLTGLHDYLVAASNVLMLVEGRGLKVDEARLDHLIDHYKEVLGEKEKGLSDWVKNPRSVKQVKAALEELGLTVESTDKATLNALLEADLDEEITEFASRLLGYRADEKLYGTYVKGLHKRMDGGYVFPSFLLHGTTSGRLSCRNPNLQNIPRGSVIRSLFVPTDGRVFVQADYSQIEYRVVATEAQDPYLADIFRNPERDFFNELTEGIFGKGWTKEHRQRTKIFVHGSNYGGGPKTLAEQAKIPVEDAARIQRQYFALIPNVLKWRQNVRKQLFSQGEDLVTHFGRHRRFWLITDENKHDVEKEAYSFVPQSTASDICLTALMRLHNEFGLDIRLPVHDSIMVEADADQAADVAETMRKVMMESGAAYSDYVPFAVDIQTTSESWGALK
jgi:uracil-DNA glycosylase family 4